jgi:RNA polymerase sigma factor (sigma-70 family)
MATSHMSEVIQHLRRTVLLRDGAGLTDGHLLEDYLSRRDQASRAALVGRHGPMVWGVCRRVLGNHHDAEDVFQATFLVLVRKAASIVPRQMVANWLYGVAHQTALNARATAAKRKGRERQVTEMPEPAVTEQGLWDDLQPLLDAELSRLPDKYRAVIILCDLEGKTRKEAARQIGVPAGTVAGRLARARAMLAKRLAQRGVALSGGALAAVLSQKVASAGVPLSVVESTITTASLLAAGRAASGAISVKVAALTEGVMKAMLFTRLRAALAVVLILGFVVTGATILTCRTAAGQDDKKPTAEKPVEPAAKQEKETEASTAWGKEVGGLQAGLGYRHGQKRAYNPGETVKLAVRVRNVSKEEVKFQYLREYFIETPPAVTDGKGEPVLLRRRDAGGLVHVPMEVNLAPGKEIEVYELKLDPRTETQSVHEGQWNLYGTGTFSVQYERLAHPDIDKILGKLATGKLELVIKFSSPPADEKKPPQKQEQKLGEEDGTAWGKEVGGLKAGLGFRPGEKRVYHYGETVTLVVRVRNVGKKEVEFQSLKEFFKENPPIVTDADGKKLPGYKILFTPLEHVPEEVSLAPGKEIELSSEQYQLMPTNERGKGHSGRFLPLWVGTGRVSVQYNRLFGNTSAGRIKVDPDLLDLTTGSLELEIKPAPPPATERK